jgi:hypothetical protein
VLIERIGVFAELDEQRVVVWGVADHELPKHFRGNCPKACARRVAHFLKFNHGAALYDLHERCLWPAGKRACL